ncbi:hypothetical protein B0T14DRAFT_556900 [Immersiella caudata]|uniref:Uncharacterized protein n=1 Tax=Immersiella caudata TaxID=314043 RepID=A0AA39WD60_9PEZI|nr:hypothetical protein B0T14DRAFT_556900 [Immersiella caudata]
MPETRRVILLSWTAMALAMLLNISQKQEPGFSPFTDYIRGVQPRTCDATIFGLLAFSATVNFCSVVIHYTFGPEYTVLIENQNWCLDVGATPSPWAHTNVRPNASNSSLPPDQRQSVSPAQPDPDQQEFDQTHQLPSPTAPNAESTPTHHIAAMPVPARPRLPPTFDIKRSTSNSTDSAERAPALRSSTVTVTPVLSSQRFIDLEAPTVETDHVKAGNCHRDRSKKVRQPPGVDESEDKPIRVEAVERESSNGASRTWPDVAGRGSLVDSALV